MSYNDMMEDRPLLELYDAKLEGSEEINGRDHWIMLLEAKEKGLSYPKRRAWVDKNTFCP
jgi:outer membrane lipoprotein-sorting protein